MTGEENGVPRPGAPGFAYVTWCITYSHLLSHLIITRPRVFSSALLVLPLSLCMRNYFVHDEPRLGPANYYSLRIVLCRAFLTGTIVARPFLHNTKAA